MSPLSRTTIWSACMIVDSLCAMIIVVFPRMSFFKSSCMSCSVAESSDDVASSSTSIFFFANNARAMLTRCYSPPESRMPRSPTTVFSCCGKFFMVLSSCANFIACHTSLLVASGRENFILL